MEKLILVRIGEIALKGLNRRQFENRLLANMKYRLRDLGEVEIQREQSRFLVRPGMHADPAAIIDRLQAIFGIVSVSPALVFEGDPETLFVTALDSLKAVLAGADKKTFKVETKRVNKNFPLGSYEVSAELGRRILERYPALQVDVHQPDLVVHVEIRDRLHVFHQIFPGRKGLPVGMSGSSLLLLSGGLDSPVAGYRMASRGVRLEALYFHTWPYTGDEVLDKVRQLGRILARYAGTITLHVCDFTDIQLQIRDLTPTDMMTVTMRRFMMRIADRLAAARNIDSLITGESLGQVASQTQAALRATNEVVQRPVHRPLIGMDKDETVALAREIGTFETSILPYADCCTVFVARHPKTNPSLLSAERAEQKLDVEGLVNLALEKLTSERLLPL